MGFIRKTEQADKDLLNIWLNIAEDNIPAADKHIDKLETNFINLSDAPTIGALKDEFSDVWPDIEVRLWPVDKYIVIYQVLEAGVCILRVFNAALDYTKVSDIEH